jgi:ethanolamine utilization protein EutN
MLIGQVIGEIVATAKHESHAQQKLLLVKTVDLDDRLTGTPYVAVDSVDAGVGDRVLLAMDGWAAMTAVGRLRSPIDAAIIGVVDSVDLAE